MLFVKLFRLARQQLVNTRAEQLNQHHFSVAGMILLPLLMIMIMITTMTTTMTMTMLMITTTVAVIVTIPNVDRPTLVMCLH